MICLITDGLRFSVKQEYLFVTTDNILKNYLAGRPELPKERHGRMRSFLRHEFHKFTRNNPTIDSSLRRFVTIRVISVFLAIIACVISCGFSILAADEEPDGELITGKEFPDGFGVVRSSLSPDKRYGVLAPADFDHYDETKHQNKLVEVNTGRTLAVIDAETGKAGFMNHGGIQPSRWSADGSFLLWEVAGKWSPRALVLLKIEDGKVKWQRDLLKMVQKEILARTRKASPTKYAAIKKRNSELDQDTYPDGFTVNVQITGKEGAPLTFPLNVEASLESDPKAMESPPKNQLSSEMKAVLDSNEKLIVKSFRTE